MSSERTSASKNRMQITEVLATLGQHKHVLREIKGMKATLSQHNCVLREIKGMQARLSQHKRVLRYRECRRDSVNISVF